MTGAAPVVETTRTEGSTQIDSAVDPGPPEQRPELPRLREADAGRVTTVQGPDGDELTINGQKGIQNNVSVDGADFNNPFFGEQRGGQRPPFTFNLDAVKEVVVVSDGRERGVRARLGRVRERRDEVRHERHPRERARLLQEPEPLVVAGEARTAARADKYDFNQQQYGFTLGGPFVKDKVFFFTAFDYQRGRSTKQTDPNRIDPALVAVLRLGRRAERERPDRPDERRPRLPREDRLGRSTSSTSRRSGTTTRGPSRRTGRSTSIRGPSARTGSSTTTRTPGAEPSSRRSRTRP